MKKKPFLLSLLSSMILITTSYATPHHQPNDCIKNINDHVRQYDDGETSLNLDCCSLNDEDMSDVVTFLADKPWIKTLHVYHNNIGPRGAAALSSPILQLRTINIGDNHIQSAGAIALANNPLLVALYAFINDIGDQGAIAIANSRTIQNVDITDNPISDKGIRALASDMKLTHLFIGSIGIQNKLSDESFHSLTKNNSLISLGLFYNNINSNKVKSIAKIAALEEIYIFDSNIGDKGAIALSTAQQLRSIILLNANIGTRGAEALASLPLIEFISLPNYSSNDTHALKNHIGDQGAIAIANIHGIKNVDLTNLQLNDETAAAFAKNQSIEFLNLDKNNITDMGAMALGKSTLSILCIEYNKIGKDGIDALKQNTHIKHLYVAGNPGNNDIKPAKNHLDTQLLRQDTLDAYPQRYQHGAMYRPL